MHIANYEFTFETYTCTFFLLMGGGRVGEGYPYSLTLCAYKF